MGTERGCVQGGAQGGVISSFLECDKFKQYKKTKINESAINYFFLHQLVLFDKTPQHPPPSATSCRGSWGCGELIPNKLAARLTNCCTMVVVFVFVVVESFDSMPFCSVTRSSEN